MYVLGGLAGALVGFLILWIFIPGGADAAHDHAAHGLTFETVSIDELKAMLEGNEVTVIDVRTAAAYLASHIPGSLQIPVPLIEGEIPHLPKGKPIVTYCSCPAEESSGQAAMILARGGVRQVFALKGGFDEWVARGFPTRAGRE